MAMTPETKVKQKVKSWLRTHAAWWVSISDRYHVGLPDIMCILAEDIARGMLTVIEVKSAVGKLTPRQLHEAKLITAAGGKAFIARPAESKEDREGKGFKLVEIN